MTSVLRIQPPYAVLLIEGAKRSEIPQSFNQQLFAATNTCIAVGCTEEGEGTTVSFAWTEALAMPRPQSKRMWFSSVLETPDRQVVLRAIDGDSYAALRVQSVRTTVSILANDEVQPSALDILCSPAPAVDVSLRLDST
jgi:hypothetical protein